MKIAILGIGRMGHGIASRILSVGGYDLKVYNRSADKAKSLVDAGATFASTIKDACSDRDVVITMLADDNALRQVAIGPGGIFEYLPKGAVHMTMGTHGAGIMEELRDAHEKAGQNFLCAPALGRPDAAAIGEISMIVAGPTEAVDRCRPLFSTISRRVFEAGTSQPGGAVVKLANNMAVACAIQAMGEAISLVRKYGVDGRVIHEVMSEGLLAGPSYKAYGKLIAEQDYDKVGFTATLALKDSKLILGAADAALVPLPSYQTFRNALLSALGHGDGEKDWAVVGKVQAKLAGLN